MTIGIETEPIQLPELAPYAERYAALAYEPLRITAHMGQGSCIGGSQHLDSLLTYGLLMDAHQGAFRGLGDDARGYRLPLPIRALWTSPEGWPLHACTVFEAPEVLIGTDVKVQPTLQGAYTRNARKDGTSRPFLVEDASGRFMSRRLFRATATARTWSADCLGHAEELRSLLRWVPSIGAEGATGFGEVLEWTVEPCDSFRLVTDDGRLRRNITEAAAGVLLPWAPVDCAVPVAYTPPYWVRGRKRLGWMAGAACTLPSVTDWFEAWEPEANAPKP